MSFSYIYTIEPVLNRVGDGSIDLHVDRSRKQY
jgi:hypothetical protein